MIDQLLKSPTDCMGCHACSNICPVSCIQMETDMEGFWYPSVDYDKCISCHRCIDVCPIINKPELNQQPTAYACLNKNDQARAESSSGGIFTLLTEQTLAQLGVVFGTALNESAEALHISVEAVEDLGQLRGSKYVQSRIGDAYKQAKLFLVEGRQVLFSGTPCQIAGLRTYLGKSYENLFTVDIICHGVPSPKVWEKYVHEREVEAGAEATLISFRNKADGWKRFSMHFSFANSRVYQRNLREDLYLRAFLRDVCLRPSCHECEFKSVQRYSDLTLADFWGIQAVLPDLDDDKGTSFVLVNTAKGQAAFNSIQPGMKAVKVDVDQALRYNPAAFRSAKQNPNRESFMRELDSKSFEQLVKLYCTDRVSDRMMNKLRSVVARMIKKLGLTQTIKRLIK